MFFKVAVIAAALGSLPLAGAARAQDFTGMDLTRMNQLWAGGQNARMRTQTEQMIQSNLNDPRVMAGYRMGICGPGLTPEQYAYKYGATGGCTAQGYANYNQTTTQVGRNDYDSRAAFFRSQQNYRDAFANWAAGHSANQQESGRVMTGTQSYYDQTTGRTLSLGYLQPGQRYYDAETNRSYSMAPNGQYYSTDGNGFSTAINPAFRSPR